MMTPSEKSVVAFNRFLADFIKDINKASPELKALNRPVYSSISMYSTEHIASLIDRTGGDAFQTLDLGEQQLSALPILATATLGKIIESIESDSVTITIYALVLLAIATLYKDPASSHEIVHETLGIISQIQDLDTTDNTTELEERIEKIKDTHKDLYALLNKMASVASSDESDESDEEKEAADNNNSKPKLPFDIDPGMLENTMIGSIAKEVVAELDMQQLAGATAGVSSIDDIFKAIGGGGGASETSNLIGSIVSKVGAKIQDKMTNGGLNQQDLVKEAFSMFGPFMGDMMKNMPNNNTKRNLSTKDRLKKKFEERQNGF